MSFDDLVSDVNDACIDVLGDAARITDGTVSIDPLPGFFRHNWDEALSNQYGFVAEAPSFEARVADLATVDLTKVGTSLKLSYGGREYVVLDKRVVKGMTLLVLAR